MANQIDFEYTLTFRLNRLATAYKNALERHMALADIHAGWVFVLIELWKNDGLRQIDLVDRIGSSAPTLNRILTSLRNENMIVERRSKDDKRSKRYYLAPLGRQIRERVETQWHEIEAMSMKNIKESEVTLLEDFIERLKSAYTGEDPRNDEE